MDGMLSQDEINALLSGMDLSDEGEPETIGSSEEVTEVSSSMPAEGSLTETVSFEQKEAVPEIPAEGESPGEVLTEVEKDAIGEVANISMGSSATTLYSLVNKKVNITTPVVEICKWENLLSSYEKPCVFIQIKYTAGVEGNNILVLKEHDVKIITDLMMGGDGTNTEGELGELHLSAISEAMNQMMGSAATSLSTMLKTTIDISPPESSLFDLTQVKSGTDIAPFLGGYFVKISFRMQIGDLVDSSIMQLYPIEFTKRLVATFIDNQMGTAETDAGENAQTAPAPAQEQTAAGQAGMNPMGMNPMGMNQMGMNQMGMNPAEMNQMGMNQMGMNQMGMNQMGMNQMGMNQMGMNQMGMNQMGMNQMGMNPAEMNQMGMNQMGMNPMGMNQMGMNPMGMNQMGMNQMGMNQMGMNAAGMQNVSVQPAQFQNFSADGRDPAGQENIGLIMDVPLEVTVELGRTTKSISEILNFAPGTIIELDRIAGEPIDVLVNGKFVARGEVVVIEESFGIRVTEIIK